MRQYLLFAGRADIDAAGVYGLVGDFDSYAEAFVALVDRQVPSEWWHILDTHAGEVVQRQHLKAHNGMIGFERSHWVVGQPSTEEPITLPVAAATVTLKPNLPDISSIEADLHAVLKNGLKSGPVKGTNGKANGYGMRLPPSTDADAVPPEVHG